MAAAGYSETPLAKKLSLKPGMRVWFDAMPGHVLEEIAMPELAPLLAPEPELDAAHIFVTRYADMEARLRLLRPLLASSGFIWVSWPKRASTVDTDITEDRIRDAIPPATDLVDVKVCAVDATWSGLKLMVRKERR